METSLPLSLVWKGRRQIRLNHQHFFRYIYPSDHEPGLTSFYGPDRSFCRGILFDTTDIIVEFTINDFQGIESISHHKSAYHGPINSNNSIIVGVYFRYPPMDYSKPDLKKHLQTIIQQSPSHVFFHRYDVCDDFYDDQIILRSILQVNH